MFDRIYTIINNQKIKRKACLCDDVFLDKSNYKNVVNKLNTTLTILEPLIKNTTDNSNCIYTDTLNKKDTKQAYINILDVRKAINNVYVNHKDTCARRINTEYRIIPLENSIRYFTKVYSNLLSYKDTMNSNDFAKQIQNISHILTFLNNFLDDCIKNENHRDIKYREMYR